MQHRVLEDAFPQVEISKHISPKLTAIVPIGTSDFSFYRSRLEIRSRCERSGVETILVDDSSPMAVADEIKAFCIENGFRYISSGEPGLPFSSPRARNAGILGAKAEWIFLEDADIVYPPSTYQRLIAETQHLADTPFNFVSVPTIYLAEDLSQRVLDEGELSQSAADALITKMLMCSPMIEANGADIEHFVPASGLLLTRRDTALGVGAYDEGFDGWGGEDRDFIYRLMHANAQIERPPSFYATINNDMNRIHEYKGWRSVFRVHGDYLAAKGLYAFHLYHPKLEWKNQDQVRLNIERAAEKATEVARTKVALPYTRPDVAPDIVLGLNPHIANTQVYSTLPNASVIPENTNVSPAEFARAVADRRPASVITWNPYGTEWRLHTYRAMQRLGLKPLVGERGALPWSLYFDSAMSITSPSYGEDRWNRPNTDKEDADVADYIENLRYGDSALEKQDNRTGAALLRHKLGISPYTKILFAPLQLATDTVTVHFSEPRRGYEDFLQALTDLSLRLPSGWIMAYKNHPLSLTKLSISSAICLDKFHINDSLEACEAVAMFNSGTGVLSMAFEKPVFYYGPAFYGIDGVNTPFVSKTQVRDALEDLFQVDRTKIRRFYRYLTQEFYSFADWKADTKSNGKALVPKVNYLYYRTIRIPGQPERIFPPARKLARDSILMDRFRVATKSPLAAQDIKWGLAKQAVHKSAVVALSPALTVGDRHRLRHDPIDFFKKAKWGPNRFFGRILLDKSERPY